jgi:D-alanyl-lipoteichoic acid acyltransferase DltB (MBOAT superfamily)
MENFLSYLTYDKTHPLLFTSGTFLTIFLVFLVIYAFVFRKKTFRTIYVLLFSLFFYYKAGGLFVLLLIGVTVGNFLLSQLISSSQKTAKKFFLTLAIISNLAVLGYFKYTGFLIFNINQITQGTAAWATNFAIQDIILPIGISFYIFQAISYSVDVYKKEFPVEKNFLDFAFYLCFFPQLVAGPIVRAKEFIPQIKTTPVITQENIGNGIFLFLLGFIKKTIISDFISQNLVDRVFATPQSFTPLENLFAVYGYTVQIYCDFSGYSDMAIGLALLLGYKLPLNFRTPFQSKSITEFWQRWHITLSSWLRDYLYIPLGGNRKGKIRTFINLFLVMLIGGLWHGASWKFVVWGGLHGTALAVERMFRKEKNNSTLNIPHFTLKKFFGIFFTFNFVAFAFIFFRANNFETAVSLIQQISLLNFNPEQIFAVISSYKYALMLIVFALFIHFIPEKNVDYIKKMFIRSPILIKIIIIGLIFRISYSIASSDVQPFIYFQF